MLHRRSPFDPRVPGWIVTALLTLAIGLTVAVGAARRNDHAADTWQAMVANGDELAAGQLTAMLDGQPLTARKAYLLAFHEAQDAGDLEHVLAVADRLEWAGDRDLAAHVRLAAQALTVEVASQPGQ